MLVTGYSTALRLLRIPFLIAQVANAYLIVVKKRWLQPYLGPEFGLTFPLFSLKIESIIPNERDTAIGLFKFLLRVFRQLVAVILLKELVYMKVLNTADSVMKTETMHQIWHNSRCFTPK